jgi:RNA polymerase sigma-70 factor (ECF subfamily)
MNKTKDLSYNEWLVINSKLGDTQALNELLKDWEQRLFLYAVRKLGDQEAAKEVVQESLISIAKSLHSLKNPAAFPKWCYQVLDRRCTDYIRKATRVRQQQSSVPLDDIEGIQGGPDMAWELEEKLTIEQALKHLDSKLALLLKLYYQESFSILEIAEITGLPEGTVKSRLYYARKMLASFLED